MSLEVKSVTNRKELRQFIYLPAKIHKNHLKWIPPIYTQEWKYFNPVKNKAFSSCDSILILAYRNRKVVGRVMGVIHHGYNEFRGEKNGRFAYLECWNDQKVAHGLLEHIETWAKKRGVNKIVGPMGFSDQNPEAKGFMIDGFESPPTIGTYYNCKYIIRLLENEGYAKELDYVVYKVNIPKETPDFYKRIYQRAIKKKEFKLIEFSRRKQLIPYINPVLALMNETFRDFYGFFPAPDTADGNFPYRYLLFIDPRFIKIVEKNDEVVSFVMAIPDLTDGIKKAGGRLFPFGVFKLVRAARKTRQLDLLLGAVKEEYRGRGLDVLMGYKMFETARRAGFMYMDSHLELESNAKVRAEMERMGGIVYKRFRIFQKDL